MAAGSRGLTREMSITHRDFFRLLPRAAGAGAVTRQGNRASIETGAGRVEINLASETVRKLGAMEFPVTQVSIEFSGFNPSDREAFLSRFDLAYQRSGG